MTNPILPQGAGYGVVVEFSRVLTSLAILTLQIGMGFFLSTTMVVMTKLRMRYTKYHLDSAEEFSNASRSVPPGLIAAGIVSAWTWVSNLLQSSASAYQFGISGPWWSASGATVQVLMFAMLAARLKLNAPYCHTYLEIIRVRWGTFAHLTFLFFALATNVIVSTMLVLGGSAAVSDLTGMNTVAACFLIPCGVAVYVLFGGMRATLIADYMHTFMLYCFLISFALIVYSTSPAIGSPERMWTLLNAASSDCPVPGNANGSYVTMRSKPGVIFGVQNMIGNFGAVFSDQSYHMRAIASHPRSSVKAFLVGGVVWFAIPLSISTSLGLAAVVLANTDPPLFTFNDDEVNAGLPAVKAIAAMLVLLFTAVTSSASSEQMAVASLLTYDVYTQYVRPNSTPSDSQIIWISHLCIVAYAVFMGVIATVFYYTGISMGYLSSVIGTIIGSVVIPISACICWRRTNGTGAIVGAIANFSAGIIGWIGTTAVRNHGVINVDTTYGTYEMLTGNCLSIGVGGVVTIGWTLLSPDDFDWEITRSINAVAGAAAAAAAAVVADTVTESDTPLSTPDSNRSTASMITAHAPTQASTDIEAVPHLSHYETRELNRAFRLAAVLTPFVTLALMFVVPMPQFFADNNYGQTGFTAWVVIVLVWLFGGFVSVGLFPVYEGRKVLGLVVHGILRDLGGVCCGCIA